MARNHGKASEREKFWRGLIGRQRASGESVAEFCGRSGVSTASFFAWKRRLREPAVVARGKPGGDRRAGGRRQKKSDRQTKSRRPGQGQRSGAEPSLVPVRLVADSPMSAASLEVELPGGAVLRVGPGCDEPRLRMVLAALADRAAGGEA